MDDRFKGINDFLSVKEKKWGLILILPLYFFFGQYIVSYAFLFAIKIFSLELSVNTINAYYNLVYDTLLMAICFVVLFSFIKSSLKTLRNTLFRDIIWTTTIGFATLYIVQIVANMIVVLFQPESTSSNQEAVVELLHAEMLPLFVTTVIIAPILEELIFRGIIFNGLYERNRHIAYIVSSFLFGFVHIYSGLIFDGDLSQLIYLLPYGVMGYVFCHVYEKRGNIFVPIYLHALNNFVSVAISLLMAMVIS